MAFSLYQSFLNILAPPFCHFCAALLAERVPLCDECSSMIKPIVSTSLNITTKYSMTVFALSPYEDPLRKLILAKNYSNILAARQLGILMVHKFQPLLPKDAIVVLLPLHWSRYAWRGFNQAEVMAKTMQEYSKYECVALLRRKRRTSFQALLNATERSNNVKQAFELTKGAISYRNRHIILIDDLMTTGATLHAAAKELTLLQPLSLTALVACRVV